MRVNNINELDRDAFALILKWLSPRDWNSASQVCRLWNERAHQNNVRQAVSRNFFRWLVERCREQFTVLQDFIDTKELIDFLIRQDIPIPCKILELNSLKTLFLEKEKSLLFFPKTLSKKFLRDEKGECLSPLFEFIDCLNSFLVHAFRLSLDRRLTDSIPRFNTILSQFYQDDSVKNFYENFPKELITLLQTDNYQKSMARLSHIENLAHGVRPQYLRRYGIVNTLGSNSNISFYLKLIAWSLLSFVAGIGLLVSTFDNGNVNLWLFAMGSFLTMLALVLLSLFAYVSQVCYYCSSRNDAARSFDNNINTDVAIEIQSEPTERAALLPVNSSQDNIENNNNSPVVQEASSGTASEVEMETDDDERLFSMNQGHLG